MPAQPRPLLLAQYRQRPSDALRPIRTVGAAASGVRAIRSVAFRGGGGVAWRRTILLVPFVPWLAPAARAQERRAEPPRIEYDDLRQMSHPMAWGKWTSDLPCRSARIRSSNTRTRAIITCKSSPSRDLRRWRTLPVPYPRALTSRAYFPRLQPPSRRPEPRRCVKSAAVAARVGGRRAESAQELFLCRVLVWVGRIRVVLR